MPAELRKMVCINNAAESLRRQLRQARKTRGAFPSEEAALKLLYLAIVKTAGQWNSGLLRPDPRGYQRVS